MEDTILKTPKNTKKPNATTYSRVLMEIGFYHAV